MINGSLLPIPDRRGLNPRSYGNTQGKYGKYLIEYFPPARRARMKDQSLHLDPEFTTFTYGDPTPPKRGLRTLNPGDLLVFYCGLEGWDFESSPALYLAGFFEVQLAGLATGFNTAELLRFSEKFHVRHTAVFNRQAADLVLVAGTQRSAA